MNKPKIGVIGVGFVGKAIVHGFSLYADLKVYDKFQTGLNTLEETIKESDYLFVCVPTPMNDDGSQDLSCIYEVMENINKLNASRKIIIIKSTVIPGTTRKLSEKYKDHLFVFNPEFLTERSAKLDFINTARIILGGSNQMALDYVEEMYRIRFSHTPIYKTSFEGAELVKYMNNCFFALKISYLNEIYEICQRLKLDYNELKDMFLSDQRIGNSHCDIPGHDGDRGYGGKCFKKDINAIIKWGENNGFSMDTFRAAENVNKRVRKNKDWENIKGATTKNKYD
jgi:UDPglucose 6-dehydrogenase